MGGYLLGSWFCLNWYMGLVGSLHVKLCVPTVETAITLLLHWHWTLCFSCSQTWNLRSLNTIRRRIMSGVRRTAFQSKLKSFFFFEKWMRFGKKVRHGWHRCWQASIPLEKFSSIPDNALLETISIRAWGTEMRTQLFCCEKLPLQRSRYRAWNLVTPNTNWDRIMSWVQPHVSERISKKAE